MTEQQFKTDAIAVCDDIAGRWMVSAKYRDFARGFKTALLSENGSEIAKLIAPYIPDAHAAPAAASVSGGIDVVELYPGYTCVTVSVPDAQTCFDLDLADGATATLNGASVDAPALAAALASGKPFTVTAQVSPAEDADCCDNLVATKADFVSA